MSTMEYYLPETLDEAVGLLAEHGPALLVMAGGTLAMPLINEGISQPEKVMGLRAASLDYIREIEDGYAVGAATTLTRIQEWGGIPLLQEAAENIGGWAIRNMGTIGGNLFAPPPAGDFAVALLALDARLKLVSAEGERLLPLNQFYTGFMTNALAPGELVAEVQIPEPAGKTAYMKFARKHSNTPAVVSLAARLELAGAQVEVARLALNAVGPHPSRSAQAEAVLEGAALSEEIIVQAAEAAAEACDPFTDAVASAWYRRKMVAVCVRRTLEALK